MQAKFLRTVSDFTLGRIEQFDARIRDSAAELDRRAAACRELVAAIAALWECLGVTEPAVGAVSRPCCLDAALTLA